MIYDHVRNQLLVTTGNQVYRFDEATGTLLPAINMGIALNEGDITADGNFLYVADGTSGGTGGRMARLVDPSLLGCLRIDLLERIG